MFADFLLRIEVAVNTHHRNHNNVHNNARWIMAAALNNACVICAVVKLPTKYYIRQNGNRVTEHK